MGNIGFQEFLLILIFFPIIFALPLFFYWLGKRAGYKLGRLEMYKKIDEDQKSKN